jgi:hypothetical protein
MTATVDCGSPALRSPIPLATRCQCGAPDTQDVLGEDPAAAGLAESAVSERSIDPDEALRPFHPLHERRLGKGDRDPRRVDVVGPDRDVVDADKIDDVPNLAHQIRCRCLMS